MSFFRNLFGQKKPKPQEGFNKDLYACIQKNCITSTSLSKIQASDLKQIQQFLEGGSKKLSQNEALTQFFLIIEAGDFALAARLKIVTAIHKFIIEIGEVFANEFLNHRFTKILATIQQPSQSKSSKRIIVDPSLLRGDPWLHANILTTYFNYLQRLSNNYQIYKICIEEGALPESEDSKLDYKLKFIWLFKISNIFQYIIQIRREFEQAFKEFSEHLLLQDIALLLLHDCVSFYNVMSKEISELMGNYPLLTTIDLIQFEVLFNEVRECTGQMAEFYKLKRLFDDQDYILEPKWFRISEHAAQEIDMYSRKVELLHMSAAAMRKTLKSTDNAINANKNPVNFTENSLPQNDYLTKSKSFAVANPAANQGMPGQSARARDDADLNLRESQRNFPQNMKQSRIKTEEIASTAKKHHLNNEDNEEYKAIKQYEELLKQWKQQGDDNEDQEDLAQSSGEDNQIEGTADLKQEQESIKGNSAQTSAQKNQNNSNSDSTNKPDQQKPYTFRSGNSDKKVVVLPVTSNIDDLNKLSSHESEEIDETEEQVIQIVPVVEGRVEQTKQEEEKKESLQEQEVKLQEDDIDQTNVPIQQTQQESQGEVEQKQQVKESSNSIVHANSNEEKHLEELTEQNVILNQIVEQEVIIVPEVDQVQNEVENKQENKESEELLKEEQANDDDQELSEHNQVLELEEVEQPEEQHHADSLEIKEGVINSNTQEEIASIEKEVAVEQQDEPAQIIVESNLEMQIDNQLIVSEADQQQLVQDGVENNINPEQPNEIEEPVDQKDERIEEDFVSEKQIIQEQLDLEEPAEGEEQDLKEEQKEQSN